MNPIMEAFEAWYGVGLTPRQRDVMFEFDNGHYTYMATKLAYDAFVAGYKASKLEGGE